MSKRAALIITDADHVEYSTYNLEEYGYRQQGQLVDPSERLLADLRTLLYVFDVAVESETLPVFDAEIDAAARVRSLLPKEAQDGE